MLLFEVSAAADVDDVVAAKIGHSRVNGILVDNAAYSAFFASVPDYLHIAAVAVEVEHIRIHMEYPYLIHRTYLRWLKYSV